MESPQLDGLVAALASRIQELGGCQPEIATHAAAAIAELDSQVGSILGMAGVIFHRRDVTIIRAALTRQTMRLPGRVNQGGNPFRKPAAPPVAPVEPKPVKQKQPKQFKAKGTLPHNVVRAIRAGTKSDAEWASELKVHRKYIGKISRGERYAHVE